ncbi:MAG TPA: hypothetical protein VJ397_10445 [Thermoplasmata archaeon]|nr:hypothetical protein [Thermoplasmata archaeon]
MPDIRERVEEDRGLLKRIQLHIPGFAGYRRREDQRQADSILRIQLADRLKTVRGQMETSRAALADAYEIKVLEPLGRLVFETEQLEGMIRHAEQGYSGFSWAIQVKEPELDALYEFDLALLDGLKTLEGKVLEIAPGESAAPAVKECTALLEQFRRTFKSRWARITGTEVA